jgi:transcriptional regulator with XRE-family HTH domain
MVDGAELRKKRKASAFSQQRLAELAGCSISTVRLVENGYQASDEMLARLFSALKDESPANHPGLRRRIGQAGPT